MKRPSEKKHGSWQIKTTLPTLLIALMILHLTPRPSCACFVQPRTITSYHGRANVDKDIRAVRQQFSYRRLERTSPKGTKATAMSRQSGRAPAPGKVPKPNLRRQLDFARNGHCAIRQAFPKQRITKLREDLMGYGHRQELLAWQQKVEVAAQSAQRARACESVEQCQQALVELGSSPAEVPFLQYFNAWRELPSVFDMAQDLAATAAVLLDCDSVRLYQDSLFWKRAGDGPTPWHTDGRMAPFDTSLLLTFWIPLHNIPSDGSALVFCSKSHSDFALPYWNEYSKTSEDPESPWNRLDERYGGERAMVDYMPMSMGDITAHSGWVLHCADPAPAHAPDRVALAVSFVDSRAPIRSRVRGSVERTGSAEDDAGHPEDAWSYRDWIKQAPVNQPNFHHDLVPILYPPDKRKTRIKKRKSY